jgi:hypothetical protein
VKISAAVLLILSLFIFSCSRPGGGIQTPTANPGALPPATDGQLGGTSSNGGGNGIRGKVLESYIVRDLNRKSYYVAFIQPLIEKLSTEYPDLAADVVYITNERDWYFIPAELDEISKTILGTYAPTDQYALQDLNKVWINSLLFDQIQSDADKATLIVHEIVMGIRLMQFKNKQDQCIAKAARVLIDFGIDGDPLKNVNNSKKTTEEERQSDYTSKKAECRKTYPLIIGVQKQKFNLVNEDYDLIRKIVSLLVLEKPDIKEVKSLIEANNFRSYEN